MSLEQYLMSGVDLYQDDVDNFLVEMSDLVDLIHTETETE